MLFTWLNKRLIIIIIKSVGYLDANHHVPVPDELGEVGAVVCVLVEGLVEEDDAPDAVVDALVGREEQLAVATPVLLRVLHPDGVQTFPHAAWKQQQPLLK